MDDRPKGPKFIFDQVRQDFFPRWDRNGQWKIRSGSRGSWTSRGRTFSTTESGYCDCKARTIFVNDVTELVIIHEICHALTKGGHSSGWQIRFRKASERALALGKRELSAAIIKELQGYQESIELRVGSANDIYGQIEDMVSQHPDLDFDTILNSLCLDFGSTPKEILRIARRAPDEFNSAKARAKKEAELREAYKRAKLEREGA